MDLHCPLTCGRCRTRRDMRISGQKIKMSDWGKLWSNKGKPQKLQCCRVQSKGVRNLESGILCFGIRNTDQKSGSHYRLESRTWSKFHWQRIRYPLPISEIRNHGRGIQNPRLSWISLHGANCHWLRLWPPLKMCKQLHHVTGGHQLHWGTRMNWSILRTCTQPNN